MAQITLLSNVNRTTSYPVSTNVTANDNCGMLLLDLTGTWTEQMINELPSINVKIFIDTNTVYSSFNINMKTVSDQYYKNATEPYVIPIYDIPKSFIFKVTPIFDDNALEAHNNNVECGNVESFATNVNGIVDSEDVSSFLWTIPTTTFPLTVSFDNSKVSSSGGSGGGGGGGSSTASQVSYDNSGTPLVSTNVQDAITEVYNKLPLTVTKSYILYSDSWVDDIYTIQDQSIVTTSTVYINLPPTVTSEEYTAIGNANIVAGTQSDGSVELKSFGVIPDIDVPIVLTITN